MLTADNDMAEAGTPGTDVDPNGVASTQSNRRLLIPALVALAVVAVDQLTKAWALAALEDPRRDIDVIGSLRFNLVYNTGSAFSRGEGLGMWIGILAIGVVIALALTLRRLPPLRVGIPMAMVAGGALGNLLDRAFRGDGFLDGAVIDFIDLQWWPVFNLADAAIVVGGIALVVFGRHPSE